MTNQDEDKAIIDEVMEAGDKARENWEETKDKTKKAQADNAN